MATRPAHRSQGEKRGEATGNHMGKGWGWVTQETLDLCAAKMKEFTCQFGWYFWVLICSWHLWFRGFRRFGGDFFGWFWRCRFFFISNVLLPKLDAHSESRIGSCFISWQMGSMLACCWDDSILPKPLRKISFWSLPSRTQRSSVQLPAPLSPLRAGWGCHAERR